jgi:hypothetical protein
MNTIILTAIVILLMCIISCNSKEGSKQSTLQQLQLKTVTVDTAHLFKDSPYHAANYFENKYGYGYEVPLVRLLTTPERYQNKRVSVHGFLYMAMEESAIYPQKSDASLGVGKNGIYIDFGDSVDMQTLMNNFNNRFVTINGVFDSNQTGHIGFNSGGITDVSSISISRRSVQH